MLKNYTLLFLLLTIVLSSCSKIGYIGQSYTATNKIEVYISEGAIKKPFQYIGKGYLVGNPGLINHDRIQKMAEELGKKKGADAVLITDYMSANTAGTTITTVNTTDSSFSGTTHTGTTVVSPSVVNNFNILFIKYNQ